MVDVKRGMAARGLQLTVLASYALSRPYTTARHFIVCDTPDAGNQVGHVVSVCRPFPRRLFITALVETSQSSGMM